MTKLRAIFGQVFHRFQLYGLIVVFTLTPFVSANAHLGTENNTEVRVYPDSMRVVLRTSIQFAWTLLGESAPVMADDAGKAIAKPLLIAEASGLIRVTQGGRNLVPSSVDCAFEVENDVAFVFNFERPEAWPVSIEAKFFERFSTLETGTITVFDYTVSRFSRNLKPLATKTLDQRSRSLLFTLEARASAASMPEAIEPIPPKLPGQDAEIFQRAAGIGLALLAVGLIGLLVFRRLRKGP